MVTRRSKRPGRSRAGSRMSGRLVAAMMMMFVSVSKPSISTRIWLRVCSRSSWEPPMPAPRWRPTASISSIKMMQGEFFLACSKRSRTRLAPTPTNISTNSEPEMLKKGTPASPETALATRVLPVPGGPTSSTPLGIRAPKAANFCGSLRNSTTSSSSCLASSLPATSSKVTVGLSPVNMRALLLPKLKAWLPAPWAWRKMKKKKRPIRSRGKRERATPPHLAQPVSSITWISTGFNWSGPMPRSVRVAINPTPLSFSEAICSPLRLTITRLSPWTVIWSTSPARSKVAIWSTEMVTAGATERWAKEV